MVITSPAPGGAWQSQCQPSLTRNEPLVILEAKPFQVVILTPLCGEGSLKIEMVQTRSFVRLQRTQDDFVGFFGRPQTGAPSRMTIVVSTLRASFFLK